MTDPDATANSQPTTARTRSATAAAMELLDYAARQVSVAGVGPVGAVLLIYTVTTLLSTIERSLNRVFGARRTRSFGRRLLMYWAAVTLAPLAVLAAYLLARGMMDAGEGIPVLSWLTVVISRAGPVVVGMVVLAAFYKLIPNTDVSFRAAIAGAVIAVPLLILANVFLAWYVDAVQGSRFFLGPLFTIPLFLIGLNVMWLIFLFGAELAHTGVNLQRLTTAEQAERAMLGHGHLLAAMLIVAEHFTRSGGAMPVGDLARRLGLTVDAARRITDHLVADNLLCPATVRGHTAYVPAKPPQQILVSRVLTAAEAGRGDASPPLAEGDVKGAVDKLLHDAGRAMGGVSLAEVVTTLGSGEPSDASSV